MRVTTTLMHRLWQWVVKGRLSLSPRRHDMAAEPYIWRKSSKTLEQIARIAVDRKMLYSRDGSTLDLHDPKQGWITFMRCCLGTYYRKKPIPSVRMVLRGSRRPALSTVTFVCESCRYNLSAREMKTVGSGQLQYTVCVDCYQSFTCALKKLTREVYDL